MDTLTRSETLQVLSSMGIDLPRSTKLSDAGLDQRLRDALNAAQYKDRLSPSLNLASLKPWPLATPGAVAKRGKFKGEGGRLVLEAIGRGNLMEAVENIATKNRVPELFVDTFTDLRQSVMGIANFLDNGATACLVQDKEHEQCAINIKVHLAFITSTALELTTADERIGCFCAGD